MNNTTVSTFAGIIKWTHDSMLSMTRDLSDDRIARQPSSTAPPIGWHLFHIGRWADRLQAGIATVLHANGKSVENSDEIWTSDNLSTHWGVSPDSLGWLETGSAMDLESAVSLASLGSSRLAGYAERTFDRANQAVGQLTEDQLQQIRPSIRPHYQLTPSGQIQVDYAGERPVAVLNDLLFHVSHANRHLGMIEALRGALFAVDGTASV